MFSKNFSPICRASYRKTDFVLLANISPALQSHVLDQMERPRFVVADTMDLWIEIARPELDALLPRVDLLILNDSEAREMTKETSLIKAGRKIRGSARATSRSRKASTARCSLAKTNSSVAAPIRWKTSTIRPGRGTPSPAAWPVILPASKGEGVPSLLILATGDDLRQRARQLQRRGVQPGTFAQPNERGNPRALRNFSHDESDRRHRMIRFFATLAFFSFGLTTLRASDWETLKDCHYIANLSNDGDSFHVQAGDKEYVFRLYFVDAPEMDSVNAARLIEQAKYFGLTVPEVIELGREASEFVQKRLSEPFSVTTRFAHSMARGKAERFLAFVQTKEGDLGEQLVAQGFARYPRYAFRGTGHGNVGSRSRKTRASRKGSEGKTRWRLERKGAAQGCRRVTDASGRVRQA